MGGYDLCAGKVDDLVFAAIRGKLQLCGFAAVGHPQAEHRAGALSGQLGGIVLRGGHDLIQKADLAVLAVIHIVDANLVAAARQVDPAGCGKQAGKVFHAGAAVIIGTFLRVGNDQVRRNINHAACAEIPHKTQRQHHKFHQNQQQDQPVLAAENFFELLQTSTLPSQHDMILNTILLIIGDCTMVRKRICTKQEKRLLLLEIKVMYNKASIYLW